MFCVNVLGVGYVTTNFLEKGNPSIYDEISSIKKASHNIIFQQYVDIKYIFTFCKFSFILRHEDVFVMAVKEPLPVDVLFIQGERA